MLADSDSVVKPASAGVVHSPYCHYRIAVRQSHEARAAMFLSPRTIHFQTMAMVVQDWTMGSATGRPARRGRKRPDQRLLRRQV